MTINLSRLCQAREPSGDGGAPCWSWLAGGLAIGSLTSLGIGYYLGKRKEERAQQKREEKQQQAKEEDAKLHQRTVIPGDFKELNEEIVRLIRAEVCSLTEQLSQALEKKQALMMEKEAVEGCRNAEWGWWSKQLGMKSHVIKPSRHALLHHQIDMDVCVGRIHELKKKIAELQSYLDRGEPVLRLSQDLENAPEIFTCPITFDVMESPVVAADGYTYEEGSIRKWLRTSRVSPKTNEDMHSTLLQPNNSLRLAIKSWRDEVHAVQSKTSGGLMTY